MSDDWEPHEINVVALCGEDDPLKPWEARANSQRETVLVEKRT